MGEKCRQGRKQREEEQRMSDRARGERSGGCVCEDEVGRQGFHALVGGLQGDWAGGGTGEGFRRGS